MISSDWGCRIICREGSLADRSLPWCYSRTKGNRLCIWHFSSKWASWVRSLDWSPCSWDRWLFWWRDKWLPEAGAESERLFVAWLVLLIVSIVVVFEVLWVEIGVISEFGTDWRCLLRWMCWYWAVMYCFEHIKHWILMPGQYPWVYCWYWEVYYWQFDWRFVYFLYMYFN